MVAAPAPRTGAGAANLFLTGAVEPPIALVACCMRCWNILITSPFASIRTRRVSYHYLMRRAPNHPRPMTQGPSDRKALRGTVETVQGYRISQLLIEIKPIRLIRSEL